MLGLTVGTIVSRGVTAAGCRSPLAAGLVALGWTCGGLVCTWFVAQGAVQGDESVLTDRLLPFVRMMVGGTINFTWLAEPSPVNVPEWLVFGTLGLSALLGVAAAYGAADDQVRAGPFCERCEKFLSTTTLWRISSTRGALARQVFQNLDVEAMRRLPCCGQGFKNWLTTELWSCPCATTHYLDVVGHSPAYDED